VPKINIPLYEIKETGITLPIDLNYNAGGIKVTEYASFVGLGWNLNAGGVINRSMYGTPDELRNFNLPIPTNPTTQELEDMASGQRDYQPDVFYFNFSGKSGKFFLGQNDEITIIPYQKIKIEPLRTNGISDLQGWKVTTEDGVVYEFRDYEKTKNVGYEQNNTSSDPDAPGPGNPPASINSWYMTKITPVVGNVINFTYENYTLSYDMPSSDQRYVLLNAVAGPLPAKEEFTSNVNRTTSESKRLKIISFSNGKIEFNYDKDRRDLIGDKMLTSIKIKTLEGLVKKEYKFGYKYMIGASMVDVDGTGTGFEDNFLKYDQYQTKHRRLTLESVKEISSTSELGKAYAMEYETGLPPRDSKSRDHWGYYNGYTFAGNDFLPYQLVGNFLNSDSYVLMGKDPNLAYCKSGTLKKITYPTGGNTQFDYELHQVKSTALLPPTAQPQSHDLNINYLQYSSLGYSSYIENGLKKYYKDFSVVTTASTTSIKMQIKGYPFQPIRAGSMSFEIHNTSGTVVVSMFDIDANAQKTINQTNGTVEYNYTFNLAPGNYRIVFKPVATFIDNNTYFDAFHELPYAKVYGWSNILPAQPGPPVRDVGGLRIKSMKDYDPVSGKNLEKDYEYKFANGSAAGSLLSDVKHIYDYSEVYSYNVSTTITEIVEFLYKIINSDTNYPLSTTQGSNVGYAEVTIKSIDPANSDPNGKSIFRYTSPENYPDYYGGSSGPVNNFPYPPADGRDWQRGLLLEQEDYKYVANTFSLVKKTTNVYNSPVFMKTFPGAMVKYIRRGIPRSYSIENMPNLYSYKIYDFKSGLMQLNKTTEEFFDGGNPTRVETVYNYGSPLLHLFPIEIKKNTSRGELTATKIKYAPEYENITGTDNISLGIKNLQAKNVLSAEIEKTVFRQDANGANLGMVSSQFISYKPSQALPDIINRMENSTTLTDFSLSSVTSGAVKKDSRYVPVASMDLYNSKGNLIQQKRVTGIVYSYKWGYNDQYPIAEIKNAEETEFYCQNFEESGGVSGNAHSGLKFYSGSYTVNWTRPNTRAYKIGFFYLTSGLWKFKEEDYTANSKLLSGGTAYDDIRIYPADAEVTTYTFDPLIGITSSIDPKGMTTYYEYDNFQRLMNIKDQDRNIVKSYDYHFKP
jgi:YD repeat-containing protein